MAEIRSFPLVRHLRAEPTSHIVFFKRGKKRKSGAGLAFWFAPLGASLAEVPLEDRDLAFVVTARSADFQEVSANGVVVVRTADPELLASRIDFSIDAVSGRFRGDPLDKLASVVVQRAQELGAGYLGRHPLALLLEGGPDGLREAVAGGLVADRGLASLGLEVVATRILAVRPSADLDKALQMPARERIQQAADEATFARRALAVDKERAIQENELANRIAITKREEQLIAQRGANEKKRVIDESEARRISAEGAARDERVQAEAGADTIRVTEEAKVLAERERMDIYRTLPTAALLGLAARELATNLHTIEDLSLSPDTLATLGPLLQRMLGAQVKQLEDAAGSDMSSLPPRVVIVSRPGELDELVRRHGTLQQARFFLASRGEDLTVAEERQRLLDAALHAVQTAVPLTWRRARVQRGELERFLFEPEDLIIAVGQDGLVANVAKYLTGQPVAGMNPAKSLYEGVLVRHDPRDSADLFATFAKGSLRCEERTMVEATLGDGQRLVALNEIFIGHERHQSARYRVSAGEASERHSSSGVIVTTGTGASGWARSITRHMREPAPPPGPLEADLAFYVREAWPSVATQVSLTSGRLAPGEALRITSEMNVGGTVFGDGVEDDRLDLGWGVTVTLQRAADTMRLVA